MWQTDFTYFKIVGWGWYYLSTVLDDYSRYILSWDLRDGMTASDVMPSINIALSFCGLSKINAPRLLSDNGSCYVSADIKRFLKDKGVTPINGKPCHPQTQGKIERHHRTMKNVVKLDIYYSPEDLKEAIAKFVSYYNNQRYHESLNNLTPSDVYFGRGAKILKKRQKIKEKTIRERRNLYIKSIPA